MSGTHSPGAPLWFGTEIPLQRLLFLRSSDRGRLIRSGLLAQTGRHRQYFQCLRQSPSTVWIRSTP